jgi:hypothetical protein
VSRLRRDPLRDLRLNQAPGSTAIARSSLPAATPVQLAAVDTGIRDLADSASTGLTRPWSQAVRRASLTRRDSLPDALDQAVLSTDLDAERRGWWWTPVQVLQWLLFTVAVVGLAWLVGLAALGWLQLPLPETPRTEGLPTPTLLLVGGVLLGLFVAAVARIAARSSARRRGRAARKLLQAAVGRVADAEVIAPVRAELDRHDHVSTALRAVRRD